MRDTPKADEALLQSILEMREFVDALIDQEKRRVGEWFAETDRESDVHAAAGAGGEGRRGAIGPREVPREKRPERTDRGTRPAPVAPGSVATPHASDPRGSAPDVDVDDPRKRLDALARRLDGRSGRSRGPSAGES